MDVPIRNEHLNNFSFAENLKTTTKKWPRNKHQQNEIFDNFTRTNEGSGNRWQQIKGTHKFSIWYLNYKKNAGEEIKNRGDHSETKMRP